MLSFTMSGIPSSGPRAPPAARRASDALAASRAIASRGSSTAWTCPSTERMRSKQASVRSRLVNFPSRRPSAAARIVSWFSASISLEDGLHLDEVAFAFRRLVQERVARRRVRRQDDVVAQDVADAADVRGRFDALHVDVRELADVFQDGRHLVAELLDLVVGQLDVGQFGNLQDFFAGKAHGFQGLSIARNSFSLKTGVPSFAALAALEPGSAPTTT